MINKHNATILVCSYPTKEAAETLAETLVRTQVAACIQIGGPISSTYIWEDTLEKSQEVSVQIKTIRANIDTIQKTIQSTHPYDTPEILELPITQIDERYYEWLQKNSSPS